MYLLQERVQMAQQIILGQPIGLPSRQALLKAPRSLRRRGLVHELRTCRRTLTERLVAQVASVTEQETDEVEIQPPAEVPEQEAVADVSETNTESDASKQKIAVAQAKNAYNVVFVTSEVAPWSKTGGLGDVCGSLPLALAARGHRVMVVAPRYATYPEALDTGLRVDILGAEVGYFHHVKQGVDFVFVDHPSFPRPGGLYGDRMGVYGDNQFRFMLLSLAALEAPLQLSVDGSTYGDKCLFICNDWMAAMVPVYLAAKYRPHGVYTGSRSIMAIHNLRHQGVFPPGTFNMLGLPPHWYGALEWQYPPHQRQGAYEEEGRSVNTLKAGLATADRVVTVSPGYSWEITTEEGGWGMDGLLAQRSYALNGVLNGIDMDEWNPETDEHIYQNYSIGDFSRGKAANKLALQKELGLTEDANIPMVGFIGRLDFQKGADLVLEAAPWLMQQGVQLVCLGTGDANLENGMRWLEGTYSHGARGWVGFNVPMSHKITAACDILVMPSRFEPCGLNQLYAMRYGTVPVAHATGGLRDTVVPFDPWNGTINAGDDVDADLCSTASMDNGTGWAFTPCTIDNFIHHLGMALDTLRNYPDSFKALQRRGMMRDSSWNKAAEEYEQIFDWAMFDQPFCR